MSDAHDRVLTERKNLSEKLEDLNTFIETSPFYKALPDTHKELLTAQREVMGAYERILSARLEIWEH